MSSSTDTERPLRKDAARNRELLIAAGREVFAERGLEASLDDIARHAGVGVGTAYRHFANKFELARAIFGEAIEQMVGLACEASAAEDPWQGLIDFVEGAAEQQAIDRGLREALSGVHDPEQMDKVSVRIGGPLNHLLSRAKKSGQVRDDVVATDFWVVVMMLCTVADLSADAQPQLWRRYLPMLMNALRAGDDTPLPVPPMSEDDLRAAMINHKQRLHRPA